MAPRAPGLDARSREGGRTEIDLPQIIPFFDDAAASRLSRGTSQVPHCSVGRGAGRPRLRDLTRDSIRDRRAESGVCRLIYISLIVHCLTL